MSELTTTQPEISSQILDKLPSVVRSNTWLLYGDTPADDKPYPRLFDVSLQQKDALSQGTVIYDREGIQIIHPENPLLQEQSEGLHLRIEAKDVPVHPQTPEEWRRWIRVWEYAIGAGKVLAENWDEAIPALWVNFSGQHDFSPADHLAIEIFGRNPTGKSWGRTASFPMQPDYNHRPDRIPDEQLTRFKKTVRRYFDRWLSRLDSVHPFAAPNPVVSPAEPDFVNASKRDPEKPFFWQNELLWKTKKVRVVGVVAAHIASGVHLMVEYNEGYTPIRPWEQVTDAVEGLVVTETMGQLLRENPYQGSPLIHEFSDRLTGSWYSRFYSLDADEAVVAGVPKRDLVHRFRGPLPEIKYAAGYQPPPHEWRTKAHWHMYGVRQGESFRLFAVSIDRGETEWEMLRGLGREKMLFIRDLLNEKLPSRIRTQLELTDAALVNN